MVGYGESTKFFVGAEAGGGVQIFQGTVGVQSSSPTGSSLYYLRGDLAWDVPSRPEFHDRTWPGGRAGLGREYHWNGDTLTRSTTVGFGVNDISPLWYRSGVNSCRGDADYGAGAVVGVQLRYVAEFQVVLTARLEGLTVVPLLPCN